MEKLGQGKTISAAIFLSLALALSMFYVFLPPAAEQEADGEAALAGAVLPESIHTASQGGAELTEITDSSGAADPGAYSRTSMLLYVPYTVVRGDIIGEIAKTFGLYEDTIISVNNIKNTRLLQIGQNLKIPNQDGILHKVVSGETLAGIAQKYNVDGRAIQTANELFSETINAGSVLFIPGARLDWVALQEINGDLFIWPVRSYITSSYGYRRSPFTGVRQFHTGIDIGAPAGTPIGAAMSGRVSYTGFDATLGNYVVITHHSGYRTLYGHMSLIRTRPGAYVRTGERIGDVGSTGLSTGPHLHFTVYKNGVTVNPRSLMK
jgi:murein DD-endopeptidase MepM/ murein hydrolase activator NlpD